METQNLSVNTAEPETVRAYRYHIPEITVRKVGESTISKECRKLDRAELVAQFYREAVTGASWFDPEKECFVVFLLDRRNVVKAWTLCTLGTAVGTLAHLREVFRAAVVHAACAVVCVHNHPSGDPSPSGADIKVTRLLREASKTLEITMLDHVIIGTADRDPLGKGFYSFREAGLL